MPRESVSAIGFDFKATAQGFRLIEFNCANTGLFGFGAANGNYNLINERLLEFESYIGLECATLILPFTPIGPFHEFSRKPGAKLPKSDMQLRTPILEEMLEGFPYKWTSEDQVRQAGFSDAKMIIFDRSTYNRRYSRDAGLLRFAYTTDVTNESEVMVANSAPIDALLLDKKALPSLLEGVPWLLPQWDYSDLKRWRKDPRKAPDVKYIVAKPRFSEHAAYVQVLRVNDLIQGMEPSWTRRYQAAAKKPGNQPLSHLLSVLGEDIVLQEFCAGDGGLYQGNAHPAVLRYLCIMISDSSSVEVFPIGGYWKMGARASNSKSSMTNRFVIGTYPKGSLPPAKPVPLEEIEPDIIGELERHMPKIYGRILDFEAKLRSTGNHYYTDNIPSISAAKMAVTV